MRSMPAGFDARLGAVRVRCIILWSMHMVCVLDTVGRASAADADPRAHVMQAVMQYVTMDGASTSQLAAAMAGEPESVLSLRAVASVGCRAWVL